SGSVGHAGATSFYPGKNLGAYGDAGAVVTNDAEVANSVKELRNWGSEMQYHHPTKGLNGRLDTLHADVLNRKLRRLDRWNALRSEAADRYNQMLDGLPVTLPKVEPGNTHVWHLYVIEVESRDRVLAQLHANGIDAGVHYPIPLHLQGAYRDLD